ncbi:sensor histidine kinase [Nonomuraea sediminis]|uniref:sensor histidine kinase n=1 Tax=Nonomuraea sediminis TaxID=2835864 RepID=UPI001BDD7966|nr:histidine kinase [Nonomuraea sediminis]
MAEVWERVKRLLSADDPETGQLVRYVITLLLGLTLASAAPAAAPALVWTALSASLACWLCFVLLDRRAHRVALVALALGSALAALAVGPDGTDAIIFLFATLLLFAAHLTPPVWAILAVAAADLALMLGGMVWFGREPTSMATHAAVLVMTLLFALHRRQFRQGQLDRARAVALDERARIARELHDVLAHSLGALRVQLEVADAMLTEKGDVEGAARRIKRSLRLATDGMIEARAAVAALREDVPPLPEALSALVAAHRRDHDAQVEARTVGKPRPVAPAVEVGLLRTAREALTNAAKHAPGLPVSMTLTFTDHAVTLRVHNTLPGTAQPREPGHGLAGMRERLALIGGTLEAGPREGEWRVTAEVPG